MMHYLKSGSLLLLLFLAACGSPYRKLKPMEADSLQVLEPFRFQPQFNDGATILYRCHVDGRFLLKKFHLSGILLFRDMPDGGRNTRAVFTNEMGASLFDFGWKINANGRDSFQVYSIVEQLNKPALIKTLRKDLELMLVRDLNDVKLFSGNGNFYYRSKLENGYAYYILDGRTKALNRIEIAGKKRVASIFQIGKGRDDDFADSLSFVHNKAHFSINAKRIHNAGTE